MLKAATFFKEEKDPFYKRGQARGIEKGIEKERSKAYAEKLDSAREMKKDGISDEQIARFTKLSIEVVEKL